MENIKGILDFFKDDNDGIGTLSDMSKKAAVELEALQAKAAQYDTLEKLHRELVQAYGDLEDDYDALEQAAKKLPDGVWETELDGQHFTLVTPETLDEIHALLDGDK